jgi:hypothetical protein
MLAISLILNPQHLFGVPVQEVSGDARVSSGRPADFCSLPIKNWVVEDYQDKSAFMIPFPSEAKTCQGQVRIYQSFLKTRKSKAKLDNQTKLLEEFAKQYQNVIHEGYTNAIKECTSSLPQDQSSTLITRFYMASRAYQNSNLEILNEVAAIDSFLPDAKPLLGFECSGNWPINRDACSSLKGKLSDCGSKHKDRLKHLTDTTKKLIPEIENLIAAQHACIDEITKNPSAHNRRGLTKDANQKIKDTCGPIGTAIEIRKNQIPWLRGEAFLEETVTQKASPRNHQFQTKYDLSDAQISKGILAQLSENRKKLQVTYKSNLEEFRCLSSNGANSDCDFDLIRSHLRKLPLNLPARKNSEGQPVPHELVGELNSYLEAEKCMLERHEDRAATIEVIKGSGEAFALTLATYGLGEIIAGLRASYSLMSLRGAKTAVNIVDIGRNVGLGGKSIETAYHACVKDTKAKAGLASPSTAKLGWTCGEESPDSIVEETQANDCAVQSLLATPALLAMASLTPRIAVLLKNNSKVVAVETEAIGGANSIQAGKTLSLPEREQELQKFISTVKTSGKQNRDLEFANNLTMEERIRVAESITGKPLTGAQKQALKEAHEMGGYDFDANSQLTRAKDQILRKAGFTKRESAILRGNGIAGRWESDYVENTAWVPRSNGGVSKGRIKSVISRDAEGNPAEVRVEWVEGGNVYTKTIEFNRLRLEYNVGQSVYFDRTGGGFSQAKIEKVFIDPKDGQLKYLVNWEEDGYYMSKTVRADSVSHIDPLSKVGTPPPNVSAPKDDRELIMQRAEKVQAKPEFNKIDYGRDKEEISALVKWDRDSGPLEIRQALGLAPNSSKEEVIKLLKSKRMKYHPDRNSEYSEVATYTTQQIEAMLKLLEQSP